VKKKIDILRAMMAREDWDAAIKLAARFPRLGEEAKPIQQGASALLSPGLYRGMGKDPDEIVREAKNALIRRYPQN
jgi:hypothetical protein